MILDPRPFTNERTADLALAHLPADHPGRAALDAFATLILRELPELEAEVGCPVAPVPGDRLAPDRPAMLIGPAFANPALRAWRETRSDLPDGQLVTIDRPGRRVIVDAPSVGEIGDAIQLLRTAIAEGKDVLSSSPCETAADVLDRLDREVRRTFPLHADRAHGWHAALATARATLDGPDDLATIQRLMATLGDAHSWARDARVNSRLPYHLHDDGATARFWSVPEGSAAWEGGVRSGDIVLAPDVAPWRDRTGSALHARSWNIGYRAMQGRVGERVALAAIRRDGCEVRWEEPVPPLPWAEPISTGRLHARTGSLRVRGWLNTSAWHDAMTAALAEMAGYERLVVDLRGNVGGALIAAQDARARFLPGRTLLGTIRFSTVTRAMEGPHDLFGEPPDSGPLWTKPVRFLTDPLCYSATEDFLQGLQGLPHVQLVGQRTGGGSGRPRTVRLREHIVATISTALTYDRDGRCIEGNGLAPDIAIHADPLHPDATLARALEGW